MARALRWPQHTPRALPDVHQSTGRLDALPLLNYLHRLSSSGEEQPVLGDKTPTPRTRWTQAAHPNQPQKPPSFALESERSPKTRGLDKLLLLSKVPWTVFSTIKPTGATQLSTITDFFLHPQNHGPGFCSRRQGKPNCS